MEEKARLKGIDGRIDRLIDSKEIPSFYTKESTMQLLPPKETDVSDRSLVNFAKDSSFDALGFLEGKGLEKTLFFFDPFFTCTW